MWTPQLLMSLQRGEGPHARALLTQIAQAFPQAIYYSLRTMVLCLREFAFKVVQVSFNLSKIASREQSLETCSICLTVHSHGNAVFLTAYNSDSQRILCSFDVSHLSLSYGLTESASA